MPTSALAVGFCCAQDEERNVGLLWNALTYIHGGAGSKIYHLCNSDSVPALGARPGEEPDGGRCSSICCSSAQQSQQVVECSPFPNLYYTVEFAM